MSDLLLQKQHSLLKPFLSQFLAPSNWFTVQSHARLCSASPVFLFPTVQAAHPCISLQDPLVTLQSIARTIPLNTGWNYAVH